MKTTKEVTYSVTHDLYGKKETYKFGTNKLAFQIFDDLMHLQHKEFFSS